MDARAPLGLSDRLRPVGAGTVGPAWAGGGSAPAHRASGGYRGLGTDVEEVAMTESIYRVTEVIGTSTTSWEDATKNAVETATRSLRDLRIAEVQKLDVKIDNGKIVAYRARVQVSFKYEG
jgi:hypothetical protein